MRRPLCNCGNPVAINYIKHDKTYYRKQCDSCLRGVIKKQPRWKTSGNRNNCSFNNLKTVCANCQRVLHLVGMKWKQGDLVPD
jgi:hypothetical protein